ncbi:MAG TPA: KR domain-containing protein, partial [Mycobacterium sp.]|nr:KR domain-containing protein [Mycobacterium sp.]
EIGVAEAIAGRESRGTGGVDQQRCAVAGELGGGTATFETRDRLRDTDVAHTFAAKVAGLAGITEQWPLRSDARVLLCSSVIGVWGGKGTAAYAAANRMLDVMAGQLRAKGLRCIAVRWGLWRGSETQAGIVDAEERARVQRSGLRPMVPRDAIEASLYDHPVDPLVLDADAARLRMFFGSQESGQASVAGVDDVAGDRDIAQAVRAELASVLSVADGAVLDLSASLFDLGVDSLLALDLRKRLRRVTGRSVPLATLLGGITGTELIARVGGRDAEIPERVELSRD